MKNLIFIPVFLTFLASTGCSGEAFTGVDFSRTGGDAQESDSGALGTGGSADEDGGVVPVGTGGRPQHSSGGSGGSMGGAPAATGGSIGTGGATTVGIGGVPGTGGTTGTGGVTATGGTTAIGGATSVAVCCVFPTSGTTTLSCDTAAPWFCAGAQTYSCAQQGKCTSGMTCYGGNLFGGTVEPCPATCTLITHNNGLGQTWQDCVPLGTYNEAQALAACEAYRPHAPSCSYITRCLSGSAGLCSGSVTFVSQCGGYEISWSYAGQNAAVGHVGTMTTCATSQDSTWN